jgi:creatinine amidohydrolase
MPADPQRDDSPRRGTRDPDERALDAHPLDHAVRLVDRTWPTVGAPLVLVPLGATEQHGPHLPLDVDATIAVTIADTLAARVRDSGDDAVVAPAIVYGSSGEHQGFAGTLSIGTAALQFLLVELGRSASTWAPRLVFVNAHGGNLEALIAAVRVLRSEGRDAAWLPCVPEDGGSHDAHAGYDETSMLARLRAPAIRVERIEPGATAPIGELLPRLRTEGVRAVSPNGVLGDPRGASSAAGERLLAAIAEAAWRRLTGEPTTDGLLVAHPAPRGEQGGADD